jgi:NAD(P)-dependent dehydrogenase (short-subunit alcohol dehydrogenase family)
MDAGAEFAGLVAVVTGGASGLGAAIARRLADAGAHVAVLDREPGTAPAGTFAVRADLTDDTSVRAAIDAVVARFGGLDVLVNNAGIGVQGDVAANDDAEWHRVWDVNVVGMARVTRAALPHLRASAHAAIVSTSSIVAHVGLPQRALYSATKGAVSALTRALAADHLADGIRVNAVSPGTAETPWIDGLLRTADDPVAARAALEARQPHGRLVSPAEIADAVAYLASPRSGSTTGADLVVDGGLSNVRLPAR